MVLSVLHEFLIFAIITRIKKSRDNTIRKLQSFFLFKVDVPGHDDVRVEAGETVLRRTDSNVGELQFRDWQSLYGGGDWTVRPAREGLMDQDKRSSKASDDDTDPEQSDQLSITGYIVQTMDGGALQELLQTIHP